MLGVLCRGKREHLEMTRVAGMNVLCAYVKGGGRGEARRLARAAKRLRRAGVRRLLESREGRGKLLGLPVVDALPLYRAVADRLILELLNRRGILPERATVVLRGECPDGELMTAAWRLCPRVRQVVIDTERGGEPAQRKLLQQFGVAVAATGIRQMAVTVRFSGQSMGEDLNLCEAEPVDFLLDVPGLVLPDVLVRTSTLCALWQAGMLDLSQVQVRWSGAENKFT